MRKSFLFLIFTLFLGIESYACKCAFSTEDMGEQVKAYEFLFYAKVESLEDKQIEGFERTVYFLRDSTYYKKGGFQPRLKVLEIFKGNVEKELDGDFLVMDNGWSNCGEYFYPGQLILIFGHKGQNGGIATTICSPNLTFKSHEDFLRKKKKIQKAA
jgi:hypothetical protein